MGDKSREYVWEWEAAAGNMWVWAIYPGSAWEREGIFRYVGAGGTILECVEELGNTRERGSARKQPGVLGSASQHQRVAGVGGNAREFVEW